MCTLQGSVPAAPLKTAGAGQVMYKCSIEVEKHPKTYNNAIGNQILIVFQKFAENLEMFSKILTDNYHNFRQFYHQFHEFERARARGNTIAGINWVQNFIKSKPSLVRNFFFAMTYFVKFYPSKI